MHSLRPMALILGAVALLSSTAITATPAIATSESTAGLVSSTPTVGWVPNNGVHAMANDGTWIYLGGTFTKLTKGSASQNAAGLVRISVATGAPDPSWTPKVSGDIRTMVVDPSTSLLYLGGDFTSINGTTRTRVGAVSTTGQGALAAWYPGAADAQVKTILQLDSSTLLVGGKFQHLGGKSHQHLAKVGTSGAILPGFTPRFSSDVYSLARPAGASFVLVGGSFTTINGVDRPYLGEIAISDGSPNDWAPGTPCPHATKICPVFAFVTTPTLYYAATGGPGGHTLAYNPTTAQSKWRVNSDGDNQALALSGSLLYIGGHFSPNFDNSTRCTLAAVDATTGKLNPSFAPTCQVPYPGVWAMLFTAKGQLVVGGDVNHFGGTADNKFAVFPPAP